jgi:thiamine biosynthesis lipoprotein
MILILTWCGHSAVQTGLLTKRSRAVVAVLLGFFLSTLTLASLHPGPQPALAEREAWVMGTRLRLSVEAPSADQATDASEKAIRELERMERVLSTWSPTSEISAINSAPPGKAVQTSQELISLLVEVDSFAESTSGAFSPRVGALVDIWDFRGHGRAPEETELASARMASGEDVITVDPAASTVARHHPLAWLDTDGFGKGAALRAVREVLHATGVSRALVDLGGQILAIGSGGDEWVISVAHPSRRSDPVLMIEVSGVSVATSGNSERSVEVDGHAIGHVLDPRTGEPAPIWGSVTVVSTDPLEADVLSTALYVMGPDEALRWGQMRSDVGVIVQDNREDALRVEWNLAMEQWLAPLPHPLVGFAVRRFSQSRSKDVNDE